MLHVDQDLRAFLTVQALKSVGDDAVEGNGLDPALLRPGRFDRQIVVDRPDRDGRAQILRVHTKGKPIAKEIDLAVLAGQTPGFTGADLANLVNEAALLSARKGKRVI